jgi:hypothetical protein
MKSMLEASVWRLDPLSGGYVARTRWARILNCVHPERMRRFVIPDSKAVRAARGIVDHLQHRGSLSIEQGNLDPSAGSAKPGKLPSPATSRTRDGASVVVGARESRAHGEGRQ